MTEDLKRIYRAMFKALEDDPNVCDCGRPKGTQAETCLGCREIARDEREREELLR